MSALWRQIVALSDPELTAGFQHICGVKRLTTKCQQNGTNTSKDESKSAETTKHDAKECLWSHDQLVSASASGTQEGQEVGPGFKEIRHNALPQNGLVSCINDDVSRNRFHAYKNGLNHKVLPNGTVTEADFQNGNACQCRYDGECTPRTNGFIRNGIMPKAEGPAGPKVSESYNSPYIIKIPLLYYIFCFGASLGNETFYILFFSFGLWTIDCGISRKISLIWCVIMYIGQASKDLVCWPRPSSPPAIRLEGRYELEYGMPSTHAMVGVAIPFAMLYYTYGVYEYNLPVAMVCGLIWCLVVSFSRLYLGMHSVLDIAAGILGSVVILLCLIPAVDVLDCLLVAHPWSVPGLNVVGLALCLAYPRLKIWSTARGDTSQVMAVFSGIYQGVWYMRKITTPEMAAAALVSTPAGWVAVFAAVGRQVFGVMVLVVVMESLKKGVIYVSATLQGLDPKDPTCKQHLGVELPYKYVGYFVPSFCASCVMPLCFQYLGCHRGNYLNEVLTYSHHFGL